MAVINNSVAEPTEESAYGALMAGNYKLAISQYQVLAKENNPVGQYMYGFMHLNGDGVEQNDTTAFKWIKKSAENFLNKKYDNQSDTNHRIILMQAYWKLGLMYSNGIGTAKNHSKGLKWTQRAANGGNADAASLVAINYELGLGTETNLKKSFDYKKLAASGGHVDSYLRLAWDYFNGEVTEKNLDESFRWYKLAAENNVSKSFLSLGLHYIAGYGTARNEKLAYRWFKRAAESKDIDAYIPLAYAYGKGEGTNKNLKESFKYFKLAAETEIREAYYPLFYLYVNGLGTAKDEEKAYELLVKLSNLGDVQAKNIIAELTKQNILENNLKDKKKLLVCKNEFQIFNPEEHDCIASLDNLHSAYVSSYRDIRGNSVEGYYCKNYSAKNNSDERIRYCLDLVKGNIDNAIENERKKAVIQAYYDELEAQRRAAIRQQSINNLIGIGMGLMGTNISSYVNPYPSYNSFTKVCYYDQGRSAATIGSTEVCPTTASKQMFGVTKVCVKNGVGGQKAVTVGASDLCPIGYKRR